MEVGINVIHIQNIGIIFLDFMQEQKLIKVKKLDVLFVIHQ